MQDLSRFIKPLAATIAMVAVIVTAGFVGGKIAGSGDSRTGSATSTSTTVVKTADESGNIPDSPFLWAKTVMSHQGYSPVNTDQYSTNSNLRFMVGRTSPTKMKVFFFLGDNRWLGTDTKDPSMTISVAHSDTDSVQVTYGLYKPADLDNKPSGGTKTVTFKWNGSKLVPLDEIPSSSDTAALSRR
jgi:hypothetical protein